MRTDALDRLRELLEGRRVVALTGAGLSTRSGIPDYRGPETRKRARNPMKYRAFMDDPEARRRYWARAVVGWDRFRVAQPNEAHVALARMERDGRLAGVITQNVDRLHHAAGSEQVVELHGALQEVRCIECSLIVDRDEVQERLLELNPGWNQRLAEIAPDGDAELPDWLVEGFRVSACSGCGGPLKPNVVFFGETVPAPIVDAAWDLMGEAEVLLVAGSSLTVFSGYRFVKRAAERNMPVAIINLGETRGDALADLCVDADVIEVLPCLCAAGDGPLR